MTDHHDPLDELASAHLDGATTAAEARRVAGDPALQARVAALRVAREALRAPGPPAPPARRERSIAAALEAYDATAVPPGAQVHELKAARHRLQPRRLVGIAAAILLLALAVPVVAELAGDGGDDDQMATSAQDSADEETSAADLDAGAGGSGEAEVREGAGDASAPLASVAAGLGSFASIDALTEAVRSALGEPAPDRATYAEATSAEARRCIDGAAEGNEVVLGVTALLEDRPVTVVVVARPDGRRTMTVADPARGCEVLETRVLAP